MTRQCRRYAPLQPIQEQAEPAVHARRQKDFWFGIFQSANTQGPRAEAGPTTSATNGEPIAKMLVFQGVVPTSEVLTSWALNSWSCFNRFDSKVPNIEAHSRFEGRTPRHSQIPLRFLPLGSCACPQVGRTRGVKWQPKVPLRSGGTGSSSGCCRGLEGIRNPKGLASKPDHQPRRGH